MVEDMEIIVTNYKRNIHFDKVEFNIRVFQKGGFNAETGITYGPQDKEVIYQAVLGGNERQTNRLDGDAGDHDEEHLDWVKFLIEEQIQIFRLSGHLIS